jgi:hypothetical protein
MSTEEKNMGVTTQTSADELASSNADSTFVDTDVVRKMRWKMDLILLPTLAVMYAFK